jgi:hypothetical protein
MLLKSGLLDGSAYAQPQAQVLQAQVLQLGQRSDGLQEPRGCHQ